ncbi:MAG TPA: hypothetical protein ENN25_06470 [Euryarchaeota archaeon]|nr:hypothetical protein [Euryarchaeota archaeon]
MTDGNENERISLRLDPEDLRLLDDFITESNEFSNRSQVARAAIRTYIDNRCGGPAERVPNEVLVVLPPLALDTIRHLIEQGVYSSISEAVADCTRHEFLHSGHLEELKRDANQIKKASMQLVMKE